MSAKEIKYSATAREKMMKGVDTLANAVKVTLGPRGTECTFGKIMGRSQNQQGWCNRSQRDRPGRQV